MHCDDQCQAAVAKNSNGEDLLDLGQLIMFLIKQFEMDDEEKIEWSLFSYEPLLKSFNRDNEVRFYILKSPGENFLSYFIKANPPKNNPREEMYGGICLQDEILGEGEFAIELPKEVIHLQWSSGNEYYAASVYFLSGSNSVHTVQRMKPGMRH